MPQPFRGAVVHVYLAIRPTLVSFFAFFKKYFSLLLPFLWRNKKVTIATFFLTLVETCIVISGPRLVGKLAAPAPLAGKSHYYVVGLGVLVILCYGIPKILREVQSIVFFPVINQAVRDIRYQLLLHLQQMPLHQWKKYQLTEILSASTRVSKSIKGLMELTYISTFPTLLKTCLCVFMMVRAQRVTAWLLVVVAGIYLYVYFGLRRYLRVRNQLWETSDKVMVGMEESLSNTKFTKFHLESEERYLSHLFDKEASRTWATNLIQYKMTFVQTTLFFAAASVLGAYLLFLMRQNQLDAETFMAIKGYILTLHRETSNITDYIRRFLGYTLDMKKVLSILALPGADQAAAHTVALPHATAPGEVIIKVDNISFAYEPGAPNLFEHLSLTIRHGEKVGLIGHSGTGKSTLCHLIAGLYMPTQGSILLKGVPSTELAPSVTGAYFHLITQEAYIRSGSIRENITVDGAIMDTEPLGYLQETLDRPLGQNGKELSAGEKERILLSRALSYQPEVLVLDDALAFLDEETAKEILDRILQRIPTVVFTTHRRSLLKGFDRVYVLKDKKLFPTSPSAHT